MNTKTAVKTGIIMCVSFLLLLTSPFSQEGADSAASASVSEMSASATAPATATASATATAPASASDAASAAAPPPREPDLEPPPPAPYPAFVTSIPEMLRRPQKTDAPRYPRDAVIGELGAGELTREHLDFARDAVRALTQGRERAGVFGPLGERHTSELVAKVVALKPVKFRVGGGKEAADGAFTFLFRIMGGEGELGGEIYFTQSETAFRLDDIVLDEIPDALLDDDKNRLYNLSPYERFY